MRQINPSLNARCTVKFGLERGISSVAKRDLKYGDAKIYMRSTHRYILTIGGERTEEIKAMTGREAKLLNSKLTIDFGAGKTERLNRWTWLRDQEEKTKCAVSAILEMRGKDGNH